MEEMKKNNETLENQKKVQSTIEKAKENRENSKASLQEASGQIK